MPEIDRIPNPLGSKKLLEISLAQRELYWAAMREHVDTFVKPSRRKRFIQGLNRRRNFELAKLRKMIAAFR